MPKTEFSYATLDYREPIIYFTLKRGIVLDVEKMTEVIAAGNKLCDNKPHCLLSDVRVPADLTPDARKLAASATNIIASAVVVKWLAQRLIANVFVQIGKPAYPLQVFNDYDKAVKWLIEQNNKPPLSLREVLSRKPA